MKVNFILFALLLYSGKVQSQISSCQEEVIKTYSIYHLKSVHFSEEERIIKVSLPEGYDETKRYPVVYTLDGNSLFELVSNYANALGKQQVEDDYDFGTNSIPPVITVGIYHNDRGRETEPNFNGLEFLDRPERLKDFLIEELVPFVDSKYSTSGYNAIIGHSNTAYFVTTLLFQETNPFDGIVAMSLTEGAPEYQESLISILNKNTEVYYFLGYGLKDNEFNSVAKDIQENVSNKNILIRSYDANHSDLPALALVDGLKHLFNKYRNFKDFNEVSSDDFFSIEAYLEGYIHVIKELYGIDVQVLEDDFGYLLVESVNRKEIALFEMLVTYDEKIIGETYHPIILFHFRKDLGDYEEAKRIAYQMLESKDENIPRFLLAQLDIFTAFFIEDLNSPKEAIEFLEKGLENYPGSKLEFSYFIAKTSFENDIDRVKGKLNLKYCLKYYRDNRYFDVVDLELIKSKE